jgi:DNA mismatch repair protein MutS2
MKVVLDAALLTVLPAGEGGGRAARGGSGAASAGPRRDPPTPASLEVDLRGLTGDEAEQATIAAVDAAVLAEQPFLRIIHGMGTGVVRDRVQRVVSGDRRVTRFGFAPRNQGGSGVTIVEFSA